MRDKLRQLAALPDLRDVVTFGGLGMVGYGPSLISPPAAWIVCGTALFWLGVRA